jgi:type VI secretion system protein ImpG
MDDALLSFYQRELEYFRTQAGEFADANPKIAGRLRLSQDSFDDPFVARLVQSFALLTARIRTKLDDEFPELTDALLGTLYPHYVAPVPSMAIAQFAAQKDLAGRHTLAAGTEIEAEALGGENCRYRTAYPVELWPVQIAAAGLTGRPLIAPANPLAPGAAAILRITLRCRAPEMTFDKLGLDRLRFFLRGGQPFALYETILNNVVSIALADASNDQAPVILSPEAIRPVGFGRDEGLLPYPARSFLGYRLLTEYFALPEKFLFIDLTQIERKTRRPCADKLEVFFYLNRTGADLERSVTADTFALGCTPIVNVFRQRAEPITLTHRVPEYRVVADARRPQALEVHTIERVTATRPDGTSAVFEPFYALRHGEQRDRPVPYWYAARRPAEGADPGTEVFLALVDLDFDPDVPADWVLSVDTICLNRDLPSRLPFGGGRPYFAPVEGASAVAGIVCLTPPTATLRPAIGRRGQWRLISHLTLNHLSIAEGPDALDALREILRLYDFRDSPETRALIDGISGISSRRSTARTPSPEGIAFARGIDVTVELDPERYDTGGLFLMAAVLDRFLGLYCSINAFTRLTATVKGRPGILRKWPARAGDRTLL